MSNEKEKKKVSPPPNLVKAPTPARFAEMEDAFDEAGIPKFKVGDRIVIDRKRPDGHIGVCEIMKINPDGWVFVLDLTLEQRYTFEIKRRPGVKLCDIMPIKQSPKRKEAYETTNYASTLVAEEDENDL